jgi:hypothetical protein
MSPSVRVIFFGKKMNKISKNIVEKYNLLKLRREFNISNAISRFNTYQKHDRMVDEMYYDPKFTYKEIRKKKTSTSQNRCKAENKKENEKKHAEEEERRERGNEEKLIYAIQCGNRYCILSEIEKNYEEINEHASITKNNEKKLKSNGNGLENNRKDDLDYRDQLLNFGKKKYLDYIFLFRSNL